MDRLPRLAIATASRGPVPAATTLALLAGLTRQGLRAQHFRSLACLAGTDLVRCVTGMPGRHLDAWLMPPDVCRAVLARGTRHADLAIVEGSLGPDALGPEEPRHERPGNLLPIAEALDLPIVAVVQCRGGDRFHLPRLDPAVDAILLDGLEAPEQFETIRDMVETVARKPVLGALEALPLAREALSREDPPADALQALTSSFLRFADLPGLIRLADSRPFPAGPPVTMPPGRRHFRVAYAQDEAFGGYFPDTLETLESLGAVLVEFSPLGDEHLPREIDLVIVGCGRPDLYADDLAANISLIAELRAFVCAGKRVYSEGGGSAYLGQGMIVDGRPIPGAGLYPFEAELQPDPPFPTPVSRTLIRDGWLGPAGTVVRGYRSNRWVLRPTTGAGGELPCPALSGPLAAEGDVFFRHHAVGSLIHLHLAALPQVVSAFALQHRPSLIYPGVVR